MTKPKVIEALKTLEEGNEFKRLIPEVKEYPGSEIYWMDDSGFNFIAFTKPIPIIRLILN